MTAFGSKFFGLEMNGPSKYWGSGLSAPLGSPVWLLSFNVVKTMQVLGYVPLNNYRYVGKIDFVLVYCCKYACTSVQKICIVS